MRADQVTFEVLDLSAQLRLVMASERLTVIQLADAAGVSKSAMEKYLAGPSSPRATAIASLCANLGLSPEWLMFGYTDNDWRRIRDFAFRDFVGLLHDIKQDQDLAARFAACDAGSKEFLTLAMETATARAEALADKVKAARKAAMVDHAAGVREVAGPFVPFRDGAE